MVLQLPVWEYLHFCLHAFTIVPHPSIHSFILCSPSIGIFIRRAESYAIFSVRRARTCIHVQYCHLNTVRSCTPSLFRFFFHSELYSHMSVPSVMHTYPCLLLNSKSRHHDDLIYSMTSNSLSAITCDKPSSHT